MTDPQPVGEVLDGLQVTLSPPIAYDDLVTEGMVILKVMHGDGTSGVRVAWSAGLDWVSRRGLTEIARDAEVAPGQGFDQEDA